MNRIGLAVNNMRVGGTEQATYQFFMILFGYGCLPLSTHFTNHGVDGHLICDYFRYDLRNHRLRSSQFWPEGRSFADYLKSN